MNAFVIFFSVVVAGVLAAPASKIERFADGGYKVEYDNNELSSAPVQYFKSPSIVYQSVPSTQYIVADEQNVKYIPILSHSQVHQPNGAFQLKYQSADGQSFSEKADVKRNFENDGDVLVKSGNYAYTAPDGTPISLSYVADEYGFRATGSHLPKAQ